jgi:ubiquitin-conjugating enzyme E2 D/E
MALKRITKELKDLGERTQGDISASPTGDNMFKLQATITGPEKTPYANGVFFVDVEFPNNYPFAPMKMKFTTKIYHPNVEESGKFCMSELKDDWKPAFTLTSILELLRGLLSTPRLEEPLRADLATQYKSKKSEFDKTAAEWTKKYAQ